MPEGGVDIFIVRAEYTVLVTDTASHRRKIPAKVYGALGWVTEQDCRSSSLQHIAVVLRTPAPDERGPRDSVLIGVHHACSPLPTALTHSQLPPAIHRRAPTAQGGALSLTGRRFDGLDRMGSSRVVVVAAAANRPALYEYGTCSRDRVIRTGLPGVDNRDVFSDVTIGRVPMV